MVATVTHQTVEWFGHERRRDTLLACHLLADLSIRDEAIRCEFDSVIHPVEFQLPVVLVVALDHVEAKRLCVANDLFENRAHSFEVFDLVGGA